MNRRWLWISLLLALTLIGCGAWFAWWCFGRPPQEQVTAAQAKFLRAVEKRDWDRVKNMLTDDYSDDYGLDRDSAVQTAQQLLGGFYTITLKAEPVKVQAVPDLGMMVMKIRMEGNGVGLSQMVMSRVNQLKEPWFFHWHKKGRWPWDWKVVQVHNNEVP